jgi:uncharacterized membrane protein
MAKQRVRLGNWFMPARFLLFVVLFAAGTAAAGPTLGWMLGAMLAFDLAALVFLAVCAPLLSDNPATIRRHAKENDANRVLLLVITAAVSLVVMVTVGAEVMGADRQSAAGIALIVATLTLSWLFSNVVYALHYAHLFYSTTPTGADAGGIDFPKTDEPDYSDFLYFAFTLGMTFQTSDTDITSRAIRRVGIAHCFAAFVFNIGVLAFTINVLGGG